jgi:hypothetical protein
LLRDSNSFASDGIARVQTRQSLSQQRGGVTRSKTPSKRTKTPSKQRSAKLFPRHLPPQSTKKLAPPKRFCKDCLFLLHRGYSTLHCCRHLAT